MSKTILTFVTELREPLFCLFTMDAEEIISVNVRVNFVTRLIELTKTQSQVPTSIVEKSKQFYIRLRNFQILILCC